MKKKTLLKLINIKKSFPGVKALDEVSMEIYKGEVHALVGENGAGKSTLINILAGIYKKDSGEIIFDGQNTEINNRHHSSNLGIGVVFQERSLVENMSIAVNIFTTRQPANKLGHLNRRLLFKETRELLNKLKMTDNPNKLVGQLSQGKQQMVEIAKALSLKAKLIILDEPTGTINQNEAEVLFEIIRELKKSGVSVIYISHRLSEIFEIADRVTVLKDGKYMGTKEIEKTNIDELVKMMVGRELKKVHSVDYIKNNKILEVKDLNSKKFRNVNLYLKEGEILTFYGLTGAGRTELARAIFGVDKKTSGKILINGREIKISSPWDAIKYGIGYLPEDRKEQGLYLNMTVSANIGIGKIRSFSNFLYVKDSLINRNAEEYRKKLKIVTTNIKQKVINLSGGNQQKIILARWLLVNPPIIIVDEPTRGIDVGAKAEIYNILQELVKKGTSVIIISSDLTEVLSISNRIIIMWKGNIVGEMDLKEASEEIIVKLASGITESKYGNSAGTI